MYLCGHVNILRIQPTLSLYEHLGRLASSILLLLTVVHAVMKTCDYSGILLCHMVPGSATCRPYQLV